MSEPKGQGRYLLLVDYGLEGWAIRRFPNAREVVAEIQRGISGPFIIAEELGLVVERVLS